MPLTVLDRIVSVMEFIELNRRAVFLGPTEAGKTQLLWAAHHAAQKAGDYQRFTLPSDCGAITLHDEVPGASKSLREALYGRKGVLDSRGQGGQLDSTTSVEQSSFEIRIHRDPPESEMRALFQATDLAGGFTAFVPTGQNRMNNFDDVKERLGLETNSETKSITNAVDSIIQCIPLQDLDTALKMDGLLQNMNPDLLRSVTICITKFDAVFLNEPVLIPDHNGNPRTHYAAANDPNFVLPILQERLSRPDVVPLIDAIKDREHADIKVMPVSGFGFLPATGQANVRPIGDNKYQMLTAVNAPEKSIAQDYPYKFNEVYEIGNRLALWRPFQAFEALFSVLFSTEAMRQSEICVFDLHEVLTNVE